MYLQVQFVSILLVFFGLRKEKSICFFPHKITLKKIYDFSFVCFFQLNCNIYMFYSLRISYFSLNMNVMSVNVYVKKQQLYFCLGGICC